MLSRNALGGSSMAWPAHYGLPWLYHIRFRTQTHKRRQWWEKQAHSRASEHGLAVGHRDSNFHRVTNKRLIRTHIYPKPCLFLSHFNLRNLFYLASYKALIEAINGSHVLLCSWLLHLFKPGKNEPTMAYPIFGNFCTSRVFSLRKRQHVSVF